MVRTRSALRAACAHLLKVLRERKVIAEPAGATGPIAEELDRYDAHLREARGLCEGTRRSGLRLVQRLLRYKFADGPVVFAQLQPEDLRQFIATQLELRGTTSNATALTSALRGYLRYRTSLRRSGARLGRRDRLAGPLEFGARCRVRFGPSRSSAYSAPLLRRCPLARRGYAMVRCALDLGLRSSEVAQLQLADIDWRAGTVTLRHTKSPREDVLPLLAPTGRALADYLRYERPKTSNPAVFVRRLAPLDQPISAHAVRCVIRDAFARIGLTHGRSHALRHTLACRLIDQGSSLKEVADVLRHGIRRYLS